MKILLVVKDSDNILRTIDRVSALRPSYVYICPIGYRVSKRVDFIVEELDSAGIKSQEIDFITEFNRNAFVHKKLYVDFIHRIANKSFYKDSNIKEYFKYPKEDFSLWWFSLVSEKSPGKTDSFTFFTKALTILALRDKLGCSQIWLYDKRDDLVSSLVSHSKYISILHYSLPMEMRCLLDETRRIIIEALRTTKHIFSLFAKVVTVKLFIKKTRCRRTIFADKDLFMVTMFPFLDEKALKGGKFINHAYGSLQLSTEQMHRHHPVWLAMATNMNSYGWRDALRLAKEIKKNKIDLFLIEEFVGIKDFFYLLKIYAVVSARFFKNIFNFSKLFVFSRDDKDTINFWPLFKDDFTSSFAGKVLLEAITYYRTFSNIADILPDDSKIVYFSEMHLWEKALATACRLHGGIKCIGIQHTVVPLLLLNYFYHPTDLEGSDLVNAMPRPNSLGCVGSITKEMFRESGWKDEDLFISGGFRFQRLSNYKKSMLGEKENQILVPLSIIPKENREIIQMLHDAFDTSKLNLKILLKSHPCVDIKEDIKSLGLKLDNELFYITDKELSEIVPKVKAMIVKESSSVFDALANRVPVIVPYLYNIIDMCPLSGMQGSIRYVKNAKELYDVVYKIISDHESTMPEEDPRDFINRYFSIYEDSSKYYENLASKL